MQQGEVDPPYDFAIGVGVGPLPGCAAGSVAVGASGWAATARSAAALGGDANPAGPLVAAALASAEALKYAFPIGEERGAARLPDQYELDARPGAAASGAPLAGGTGPGRDPRVRGRGSNGEGLRRMRTIGMGGRGIERPGGAGAARPAVESPPSAAVLRRGPPHCRRVVDPSPSAALPFPAVLSGAPRAPPRPLARAP